MGEVEGVLLIAEDGIGECGTGEVEGVLSIVEDGNGESVKVERGIGEGEGDGDGSGVFGKLLVLSGGVGRFPRSFLICGD